MEQQARAIVSAAMVCLKTAADEWTLTSATKRADKLLGSAIAAVRS